MSDTECDLEQLTALLEEGDDDESDKDKSSEGANDGNPHDNDTANKCNREEATTKETIDNGTFEELSAIVDQSDNEEEEDETLLENKENHVKTIAEIEKADKIENSCKKESDENSDNSETVKNVDDETGISNEYDKANNDKHERVENNVSPIESNSCEDSGRNDIEIHTCDNNDKHERANNGTERKKTHSEDIQDGPKDSDTEVPNDEEDFVKDNINDRTEIDTNRNEGDSADADDYFDDDYDSDMEEMMKTMENQSENTESQDDNENFPQTSQESQSDSEIVESLQTQNKENVNQSEEELSEEEIETQYDKTTGNKSDSEDSDNLEDWFDEKESESETEQKEAIETLPKEDILAEMKRMRERMKQLENLLVKSDSTSKAPSTVSSKSSKTKTTNSKKAHIQGKHAKTVSGHSNEPVNKLVVSTTAKIKEKDSFKKTEYHVERKKSNSETGKKKPETKNRTSPKSSDRSVEKQKMKSSGDSLINREKHHSDKKRRKTDDHVLKDEANPFFAATPSSEDPNLLSTDPRSLFGDSDDSDWEGLDGEKKSNLSDEGRQIKKILNKSPRQRVAHTAKYDTGVLKKSPPPRWSSHSTTSTNKPVRKTKPVTIKPELNPETGTVSGKYTLREEYKPKPITPQLADVEETEIETDPYCGIRIINPRISMSEFKSKMSGRAMVRVSQIHQKVSRNDLQKDNWVTIGVVIHRTEPRQSAAGKQFSIWKLSDLKDCDKTVSFFLFGNVYKEHWKNDTGTVIGLLNATMMDKSEKSQSETAFTINHPQQLLIMGHSKDLGRCKGTTKAGNPCSHFINKSQGEFCTYHVQAAYKKSSAKRSELQASTGITPKAFGEKGRKSKDSFWVYGGQTFTSMRPQEKSSKDQVTLKKLKHAEANKGAQKVTTMSLHELEPEDEMKFKKLEDKDAALLEKLMVPTVGSMNLVKHLVKKDKPQLSDPSKTNEPQMESVSANDLLKQHQSAMKQRLAERKLLAAMPKLGKGFSAGQDISLDVPVKKTASKSAALAKSLAVAKLKEKGGVQKEDPNAVRKKLMSPEQKEKIRKRVAEDQETESKDNDPDSSEPPKKRSKFLGNVDLNDPEVQKLLKSRSKHKGALAEAEAEHEDKYFMALEKKEKMEEKMDSVMEVEVKLFRCKQCQYTAYSLGEKCKKENHDYQVRQGMKRFFKCRKCKKRTDTFLKFPTKSCQDCGSSNFERVSMLKERKGPKLESEELSLRGNEQKYLGSLNQKNFLNL